MMQGALAEHPTTNPIDVIETIVTAREWPFDRRSDEEMAAEVPGRWCDYGMFFAWSEELKALHFSCALDMRVPEKRLHAVYELLAALNERMWLGHFVVWREEGVPMFRHTLWTGGTGSVSETVEDLVEHAVAECERFYTAFQFVIWAGKSPAEAIEAAMLDTVGEA